MTRKSPIVKVLVWLNPGYAVGGMEPRWDIEIVRKDGSRERMVNVAPETVKELLELGERAVHKAEE